MSGDGYLALARGIKSDLEEYTRLPHIAGGTRDRALAEWTRAQWEAAGVPSRLVEYEVLLNTPLSAEVSVVSAWQGQPYRPTLREASIPEDPTSQLDPALLTRGFHGYSFSGNATGQLVYVNYCRHEDFEALRSAGVLVRGMVVLCRYGKVFRGNKVEEAQLRGAVAVLIYSDPADDGAAKGATFPAGPYRPAGSLQRGSVYNGEGDPLTPGWAAEPGAYALPLDQATDRLAPSRMGFALPKIPSLPLTLADALPLLQRLDGRDPPDRSWVGGVEGLRYAVGVADPGRAGAFANITLFVRNDMEWKERAQIWNVVGTLRGALEPDRQVILGNHRDAWVAGAVDPSSGSAALMAVVRTLGAAARAGWRPRRTIVFASWDAEEYALVGSVEHGEQFAAEIATRAVAYLNVDEAVQGPGRLAARATPSLVKAILGAAALLPQPHSNATLRDAITKGAADPVLESLGAGSDFTVFLQHLGVASADFTVASDVYSVYHSVYDSFAWMSKFGDPDFTHHASIAAFWAVLAADLADSALLPLEFVTYADYLERYLAEVKVGAAGLPIERAIADIRRAAQGLEEDRARLAANATDLEARIFNDRLVQAERAMLLPGGLARSAWFKHAVFSPGAHDAYAGTKFPGLADAVFEGAKDLTREVDEIARALRAVARALLN